MDPNQEYEKRRKFDKEAKFLGEIMAQQLGTEVVALQHCWNQLVSYVGIVEGLGTLEQFKPLKG